MENLKIRVDNDAESREVQELFFELDYKWFSGGNQVQHLKQSCSSSFGYLVAWSSGCFTDVIQCGCGNEDAKEITLPELRDLVVLKRNDVGDANYIRPRDGKEYFKSSQNNFYHMLDSEWIMSTWENGQLEPQLKPIEKKEMKAKKYLMPSDDYKLIEAYRKEGNDWIEIPEGAIKATFCNGFLIFWKDNSSWNIDGFNSKKWRENDGFDKYMKNYKNTVKILWQRHTHPEELPFIDDEPSINDQYAEIEKVRQSAWQKQEGGSHYKNLKIQPMQYALENKLDYAQANVVKYVTRHKEKNGKEDLLKAIHNLELMIEFYYGGGE